MTNPRRGSTNRCLSGVPNNTGEAKTGRPKIPAVTLVQAIIKGRKSDRAVNAVWCRQAALDVTSLAVSRSILPRRQLGKLQASIIDQHHSKARSRTMHPKPNTTQRDFPTSQATAPNTTPLHREKNVASHVASLHLSALHA